MNDAGAIEFFFNGFMACVIIALFLTAIRPSLKTILLAAAVALVLGVAAAPGMVVQYYAHAGQGRGN